MKKIQLSVLVMLGIIALAGCITISDKADINIKNSNEANTNIKSVFIKKTSSKEWGSDKLASSEIKPNASKKFQVNKCTKKHDVKVVYLDETTKYKRNLNLKCEKTVTFVFSDN